MRLDGRALGLAGGILWAFCLTFMTVWVMIFGGGGHLVMLERFYWGYDVTLVGALIGAVYAFIDGFLCGWILALLYNRFARA